ncbi:ChaB family protein [Cytobacillus sp. FJAT-54145]|uniref:ChaB family protein n=1 Tax=Cytobacillus spartinae TaxID=3299023 RepID=A0ABW6K8Q8_9BACI
MPYSSLEELPKQVSNVLPKHGQEIFKEAFNSAEKQYEKEETAFKVAWSAVEQKYEKAEEGRWKKKE